MELKIAGCDLGKASAGFVVAGISDDGAFTVEETQYVDHEGKPFEAFEKWCSRQDMSQFCALGATGLYAADFLDPALVLPEDACREAVLEKYADFPDEMNLVSVGARGYSILSRKLLEKAQGSPNNGKAGRFQYRFIENEKCSSGTGENMKKIAARFGLSIAEADALAANAPGLIPITARCSVFAKSEMTHHANSGKPTGDLFAGFFDSVAKNTAALLSRNKVSGPVYLIGGCSRIESFVRALGRSAGQEVLLPENHLVFDALGAALMAAGHAVKNPDARLPKDCTALFSARKKRFAVLAPAAQYKDKVTMMPADQQTANWESIPAVLGLDLGSTGAKAVLTSIETGQSLFDVYDCTRGNPVDASYRLISAILEKGSPDIRAIGLTGSGREAVATLARAVYPDSGRVCVLNEIVAHARAAIKLDPEAGADMSIVEIGGQDAKYIRISGGRITESDMNKACSAGTGSFLEEQALCYNVNDIAQFTALASSALRPPDLGQMCTVFIADSGAQALNDGFSPADIFAGFQYSVINNYLNRVMGQRTLGKKVSFQGKPASNPSLAWTLAAVTGREIVVPPNPGAMGAWGIGISTVEQSGAKALLDLQPIDLTHFLDAQILERTEFTCRDKKCKTLCPIQKTTIQYKGQNLVATSGGACPKYEIAAQRLAKLEKNAPNPFMERAGLLMEFERQNPNGKTVAIPMTGPIGGYLPFLATLVFELGHGVKVLRSNASSLARGEHLCNSYDSCGPVKITHAICDTDDELLFFPKIMDFSDRSGPGGQPCVTEQAMPEMIEQALKSAGKETSVIRPKLFFAKGLDGEAMKKALLPLAKALKADPALLGPALKKAAAAQNAYEQALEEIGGKALNYAKGKGVPAVVVCGSLHVIHDPAANSAIPDILRQNGAVAIPADCYPIAADTPELKRIYWGDANRYLRAALSARNTGDAYPLMLSSFGCGPASFTEQSFQALLDGYPHTILESDGHGGAAGFVTRIQAFLQSVYQYRAQDGKIALPDNSGAVSHISSGAYSGKYMDRNIRYVFFSSVDYLGDVLAAVYRSYGYDAVSAPPVSEHNYAAGKRDCSGKECMSYQLIWGAFREYLDKNPVNKPTRLVQLSGRMCRAGMYPVKDRLALARMGMEQNLTVVPLRLAGGAGMAARTSAGVAALDIIRQLYIYFMPVEQEPGQAKALYQSYSERIIELIAQKKRTGIAGPAQTAFHWAWLNRIVAQACKDFARMEKQNASKNWPRSTIFVSGDPMTKGNDVANGGLFKLLSDQGVRAVVEPAGDIIEYFAREHPQVLFGQGSSPAQQFMYLKGMVVIREQLYKTARKFHPWLPMPDMDAVIRRGAKIIDPQTAGGTGYAVGSVLYHWESGIYDGVLMTSPWGCDNGLVEESLLRNNENIPFYFFYDDGTPIDQRKVRSFAFRLNRQAA
jgi:activator of 2-hydroxyglutaryl-CoA dehydratase/predicted nucleotide-binding protein (sugar kinase/HSP70/actin superfamily)